MASSVTKIYRFRRDSYVVDVALEIRNEGARPWRLTPTSSSRTTASRRQPNSIAQTFGAQSFTGFAVYTEEKKFQKITLVDIDKGKADYLKHASDGWIAMVQHYFVAALAAGGQGWRASTWCEKRADGIYVGRRDPRPADRAGRQRDGRRAALRRAAGAATASRPWRRASTWWSTTAGSTIIAWPLFWLLEKFHALSGQLGRGHHPAHGR